MPSKILNFLHYHRFKLLYLKCHSVSSSVNFIILPLTIAVSRLRSCLPPPATPFSLLLILSDLFFSIGLLILLLWRHMTLSIVTRETDTCNQAGTRARLRKHDEAEGARRVHNLSTRWWSRTCARVLLEEAGVCCTCCSEPHSIYWFVALFIIAAPNTVRFDWLTANGVTQSR